MEFTLSFLKVFSVGILYMMPILILLLGVIVTLGLVIGRIEHWTHINALYHAFITATTVGYGDLHPKSDKAKIMAVLIALTGLVLTGFIVSVGIHAVAYAFHHHHLMEKFGIPVKTLIE